MRNEIVILYSGGIGCLGVIAYFTSKLYNIYLLTIDLLSDIEKSRTEYIYKLLKEQDTNINKHIIINSNFIYDILNINDKTIKPDIPIYNMLLLTLAGIYAYSNNIPNIGIGLYAGDGNYNPDAREEFLKQMEKILYLANSDKVDQVVLPRLKILSPSTSKLARSSLVKMAYKRYQEILFLTWSCQRPFIINNKYIHCGVCRNCIKRKESFLYLNIKDPTEYYYP